MDRINSFGKKAIEYKTEMLKDYPKIVKNALQLSISTLVEKNELTLFTQSALLNNDTNLEEFHQLIKSTNLYLKTPEELFQDFENIRESLNTELEKFNMENIESESEVDNDKIIVYKTFSIDEDFVINYFGVDRKNALKLMGKKECIQMFASLRLEKILKDYLNLENEDLEHLFILKKEKPYYEIENNSFNIKLLFSIDVDMLDKKKNYKIVATKIKKIYDNIEKYYNKRMGY